MESLGSPSQQSQASSESGDLAALLEAELDAPSSAEEEDGMDESTLELSMYIIFSLCRPPPPFLPPRNGHARDACMPANNTLREAHVHAARHTSVSKGSAIRFSHFRAPLVGAGRPLKMATAPESGGAPVGRRRPMRQKQPTSTRRQGSSQRRSRGLRGRRTAARRTRASSGACASAVEPAKRRAPKWRAWPSGAASPNSLL